jgi:hypothetical protein
MDAENWLKLVEKKLEIAQCTDHEKVPFCGTPAIWNCNRLVGNIS